MGRRTYTPEQIINKLREVEVFISQGATAAEASRKVVKVNWFSPHAVVNTLVDEDSHQDLK